MSLGRKTRDKTTAPASGALSDSNSVVFVIDDDQAVRAALKQLLESVGLTVLLFQSTDEFLQSTIPDATNCLVLEMRLPEMSGFRLQEELAKRGHRIPLVFLSGYGDIAMAVRAIKLGAADFLTKPVAEQDLLDAVFAALQRDRERRAQERTRSELRARFDSLSPRERQVLLAVVAGGTNKQIAADLGLSQIMVKVHRAKGMRKMNATSLVALIKMLDSLTEAYLWRGKGLSRSV
jgi:FixJ family two-component response regulator